MSAKLTKAQVRALTSAAAGPLKIDAKGALAWDGSDGSRHQWSPVIVLLRRKLLVGASDAPHQKRLEEVLITGAGILALLEHRAFALPFDAQEATQ